MTILEAESVEIIAAVQPVYCGTAASTGRVGRKLAYGKVSLLNTAKENLDPISDGRLVLSLRSTFCA